MDSRSFSLSDGLILLSRVDRCSLGNPASSRAFRSWSSVSDGREPVGCARSTLYASARLLSDFCTACPLPFLSAADIPPTRSTLSFDSLTPQAWVPSLLNVHIERAP